MATIKGPSIQVPSVLKPVTVESGTVAPDWAAFFHSLQQTVFALTRSGPTTSRPTSELDGRYIGMQYFDTTLGYSVYLKSVNPDVWVDGGGTVR